MADRVSASIILGGRITTSEFAELSAIIAAEDLSIEWDGPTFKSTDRTVGEPLHLNAHQVPWGCFETLESWCVKKKLPFARWSGGCPGSFDAERVVFTGGGEPTFYTVDEDNCVVIGRRTVNDLGSIEAILAHFAAADFQIPSLVVDGDPTEEPQT